MSTFNLDGIQFTADNTSLGIAGKKTLKFGNANNGDFADVETDGVEKFVNAVEIDWNGMQLGDGQVINTTGELASYISTASTAAVNAQSTANDARNETHDIRNELSSYITKSELAAKGYITTSAADNKYQPKGSYLSLTGGLISNNPSEATDIYTRIEPDNINLVNYNDINNDGSISANKRSSITSYEFKLEYTEYQAGTEESTIVYGPYSCTIKADDIVIKHKDNEVNGLSYLLDKINTLKSTSDNKYQPKGNYIKYSESSTLTISYDNISNWNDAYNGINNKANSSELANYLPLTGGTIQEKTEGGVVPVNIKTIGIHPDKIELTNGNRIYGEQKNVNITVDGISVKSSVDHNTSGITSETTYCTITPNDVIIKNNDVEINGLSYLLNKITDLKNRIDALESKTGGTIIKDPTQQGTTNKPDMEVVTP